MNLLQVVVSRICSFLDIQMPGKDGMERARILRQKDDEVDVAA